MSKSYSLSKISLAITLSIAGQSAFAEINVADSNTQVTKKQNIEIINCCRPRILGNITAKNGNLEKSVISHFKRILTANFLV